MVSKLNKGERKLWDTLKYSYDRGEVLRKNPDILRHVILSRQLGKVTEPLGEVILYIANRCLKRKGWPYKPYHDDMVGYAVLICLNSILKFNANKSQNPYAYIMTVCSGAFCHVLGKEKREEGITQSMIDEQEQLQRIHLETWAST